ncbi:hypothetical protein FOZ63_005109 [Perkinsus olseni]|uniref:DUF4833 domain-containing protein n=1 Tax=Perkinsus olseni TaxID=32597 RepID=A0A7J6R568_PEROL|nr:hypothetical protein FOZ63_005109 [Perkinsus olseni]
MVSPQVRSLGDYDPSNPVGPFNHIPAADQRGSPLLLERQAAIFNDPSTLIIITRNKNDNTVAYRVKYGDNGKRDQHEPVHGFWVRFSDHPEVSDPERLHKELGFFESKLAYGCYSKRIDKADEALRSTGENHLGTDDDTFLLTLHAVKSLPLTVIKGTDGKYRATAFKRGKQLAIYRIYVYAQEHKWNPIPTVKYVNIHGIDPDTESQTASMNVSRAQQQAEESQMEVLFPVDSEYRAVARQEAARVAKEDPISSSDSSTDDDSDIDEAEQASYYKSDEGAPLWGALKGECGFKYEGPEPTRHGDWQYKGRCTDF